MLTENQILLLRRTCEAAEPESTGVLANVANATGHPFGENAARNAMSRLEARGFVVGSGAGRAKTWVPTAAGHAALSEAGIEPAPATSNGDGPTPDPDESREGGSMRTYVVLEECTLADAVREALPDDYTHLPDDFYEKLGSKVIYDKVATPAARNTEHAYRQTAKTVYPDVDADPVLVAVADKMFQPTPVRVQNRQTVSIG